MKVTDTKIEGVKIITPEIFKDNRGYFLESFSEKEFKEKVADIDFVQDNESKSCFGVVRGLHFQKPPYAQAKLVRCVMGVVFDVCVDLRKGSPTYGKYEYCVLSEYNHKQFFIPEGFAHGFIVLSDNAIFQYKCNNFYNKESEDGIAWDSADIKWPLTEQDGIILSDKDKNRTKLIDLETPFVYDSSNS